MDATKKRVGVQMSWQQNTREGFILLQTCDGWDNLPVGQVLLGICRSFATTLPHPQHIASLVLMPYCGHAALNWVLRTLATPSLHPQLICYFIYFPAADPILSFLSSFLLLSLWVCHSLFIYRLLNVGMFCYLPLQTSFQ